MAPGAPDVSSGSRYALGNIEVDAGTRRVTRDGEPIVVGTRQLDVLLQLVSEPGLVLSKNDLTERAWGGIAVTDNSLEQAISGLRRLLGGGIETIPRQGYRLTVPVVRLPPRVSDASLDALLAPHRAWLDGRAALESLERTEIVRARDVFQGILDTIPDQPSAHIGLANACIMQFEMTRADRVPNVEAREQAAHHAREACRLDPESGEAWATLAFVLDRQGQTLDALAAVRRAVTLEPDNWRHHFRRAYASWGEERLRAVQRTLALLPGFPLAHVLAATVHVARHALDDARRELSNAIAVEQSQRGRRERFSTVALHWLHGLVLFACGDADGALSALEREVAAESRGHLYAREFAANAWHAMGAIHLSCGRRDEATVAFGEALSRIDGHPLATVGLACARGLLTPATVGVEGTVAAGFRLLEGRVTPVDLAIVRAAALVHSGQTATAAREVEHALAAAPAGNAGWSLPVEPLIRATSDPSNWSGALACLQARAA